MNRTIKWDITNKCGLRCRHCYNSRYFAEKDIHEPQISEVMNALTVFEKMGASRIHFLGGEPLMSLALIPALLFAKNKSIITTITTNGMLLSANMMEMLLNLNVAFIAVSLDGITEETNDAIRGNGVFRNVVSNLKTAVRINRIYDGSTKIYITLTLTKKNASQSAGIMEFAKSVGVDGVLVATLDHEGDAVANWDEIALTTEEWVDSVESIVAQKHLYPDMYLEVVCKKPLSEYLYRKYGWKNKVLEKEADYCNGTDEEYYVRADGTIWPCRKASDQRCRGVQEENGCDCGLAPNAFTAEPETVLKNTYLSSFYRFSRDIETYTRSPFCLSCKCHTTCIPCPLDAAKGYVSDECVCARKRLKDYMAKINEQCLQLSDDCFVNSLVEDSVSVVRIGTQETVCFQDLEREIIDLIRKEHLKLGDLIRKAYEGYEDSVGFDEFSSDIMDFVFDLLENKIVCWGH